MKKRKTAALMALVIAGSAIFAGGCAPAPEKRADKIEYGKKVPERFTVEGKSDSEDSYIRQTAKQMRSFAVDSSNLIFPKVEGNYIYSPASLYMALQLTGSITSEGSAADLMDLLGVKDREELRLSGNALIRDLSSDREGAVLKIGNSIWVDNGILPEMSSKAYQVLDESAKVLGADIYHLPLTDPATVEKANSWISDRTDGMIREMPIKPEDDTAMMLFNTLYFDKHWDRKVSDEEIYPSEFYIGENEDPVKIDKIHYEMEDWPYIRTDHAVASRVLYEDGSFVIFIKPDSGQDLNTVMTEDLSLAIKSFTPAEDGASLGYATVAFGIPLFDYEVKLEQLEKVVSDLGVTSVFSGGSFSEIDPSLYVSSIAQDCRIIMDREGTKAAAVTQIEVRAESVMEPEEIIDMNLDHEYGYVIMSKDRIPLFIGAVRDPRTE